MLDYYLKFFADGITKREFGRVVGMDGCMYPRLIVVRLAREEWIVYRDGKWWLTQVGKRVYARYLGTRL